MMLIYPIMRNVKFSKIGSGYILNNFHFQATSKLWISRSCATQTSILSHKMEEPQTIIVKRNYCSEEKRRESENLVSQDIGGGSWKEIYSGLLSSQVKLVKSFSLGTTLIGLSIQPVIINYLGSSMGLLLSFSTLIGMFTFVTPALIHMFTRKYVFKLQYDQTKDIYKATTLSFFLREKVIEFKPSDVTVPDTPHMFTTFIVNKKPLFVDMETFQDMDHYGRIMGYDKPIDFSKYFDDKENKN